SQMNSKKIDLSVGVFVYVGIFAILYLAIKIGGGRFAGGDAREVQAIYSNAGGLNPASNVMIAGVKVGAVSGIDLDTGTLKAVVTFAIRDDIPLYDVATASIRTNGRIGDKYIVIYPGTPDL